jgi:hypothetical protein
MEFLDTVFHSFIYVLRFVLSYDVLAMEGQVAIFILKGMYIFYLVILLGVVQKEKIVETELHFPERQPCHLQEAKRRL